MAAADDPTDRILELARRLIQIPSRAGIDSPEPILDFIHDWSRARGLDLEFLTANGAPVGLTARLSSGRHPSLCLDACVDTAPFGDESRWTHAPVSGVVEGGRLFGRGAADSKMGAAIFLVLAAEMMRVPAIEAGRLHLLLDADEHTGEFRGVKEFLRVTDPLPDAMWIGYPGDQKIVAGSRGFLRARVVVSGVAAHAGSKRITGVNAVSRAAHLIARLEDIALPAEPDPEFSFGPSLTITAVHGGEGFSVVPDRCEINLDTRLTPSIGAVPMQALLEAAVREFDERDGGPSATQITWEESWPAFRTPDDNPAVFFLRAAAESVMGRSIPTTVSGPSNIGNFVASRGVWPTAGFGVRYENIHATDEWCETASIGPVYEAYRRAVLAFFGSRPDPS